MNKIIPQGWKEVRLEELCKSKPDYGLNAPATNYNPLLPLYLRITDITFDGLYDQTNAVSVEYYETAKLLSKNDFLFARTGATVGKTYLHKDIGKKIAFAGYLIRFVLDQSKIIPYFLKLYCQTIYYLNWVRIYSLRSGQPGINAEEYSNLTIFLPPLSEQIAIAKILSEWDHAIDLVSHKIELKERVKKGLMQQLLTGKVRLEGFSGEWKTVRLREIGIFVSGTGFPEKEQGGTQGIPYYKVSDMNLEANKNQMIIANNYVTSAQIKRYRWKIIDCNAVIFAKVGAAIFLERKKLAKHFIIDNNMMAFIPKINFLFAKIIFDNLKLSKYAKVGALPSYNGADLETIKVIIPIDPAEQTAIAEILTTADDEISLLKKQLDALKQQKKGLMQKLLTGEWSTKNMKIESSGDEE